MNAAREAEVRAFPGAEGSGTSTRGGWGGQVIGITTLEPNDPDDGEVGLQEGLDVEGRRIIVFRVGGTIVTTTPIRVRESYVPIAGQTEPGDGIAIRGAALSISTHDVMVRGMRTRVGDDPAGPTGDNRDGLAINQQDVPHISDVARSLGVQFEAERAATRVAGELKVEAVEA